MVIGNKHDFHVLFMVELDPSPSLTTRNIHSCRYSPANLIAQLPLMRTKMEAFGWVVPQYLPDKIV